MDRIPETIDVAVVADRIKPLAHQASESLHHTSEGLRQALDHARVAIVDRIDTETPVVVVERPAAVAMAARSLPLTTILMRARRSPVEWLVIAIAAAVVATLTAIVVAAIVRRLQRSRYQEPLAGPAITAVEPVAIPISETTADAVAEVRAGMAEMEDRVAEAG